MDSPPPTPQTDCDYNNTDEYSKDNCLFINTLTTTTTNISTTISSGEYFGEDLFGRLPQSSTVATTTYQGFFPPISESAEGDDFFSSTSAIIHNNYDDSVMDDDDIFAEINDTLYINDNLQSTNYPITTDDFVLF